jgi:hypothetical protein
LGGVDGRRCVSRNSTGGTGLPNGTIRTVGRKQKRRNEGKKEKKMGLTGRFDGELRGEFR